MMRDEPFTLCHHTGHRQILPHLGSVCVACLQRLEQPVLLEGVVEGPSVRQLAEGLHVEMNERIRRLRTMAEHVLGGGVARSGM